ncbi:MAG: 16S rRNA (cytosine(1402)-N(4))-methyltransferase RsmH [Candidatus Tectomicrobia bacterium]|nr:16S rRNA (cytosine(1402)-N(4))-methyltransferase RsmH [Candidatus Tectomicrobia bacterium]
MGGVEHAKHVPVMVQEVLEYLRPKPGGLYVDATLGAGGHAERILGAAPGSRLIGIDCDAEAIDAARARLRVYGERACLLQRRHEELAALLTELGVTSVDGLLFDLGVSSLQLEAAGRGFSFLRDGPLDMRFDARQELTAAQLLATATVEELTRLLRVHGEERWAARIAKAVVQRRGARPLRRTGELAALVGSVVPRRFQSLRRHHVATQTFQALRVAVNRELCGLAATLRAACRVLGPQGRLCVISFHSGEDRIVKEVLRELARGCVCPPRQPVCTCGGKPLITLLTRRPRRPSAGEVAANPRARSARLRAAERLAT